MLLDMYFNATCKYGPKCIYCAPEGEIDRELRRMWVAVTHIQVSHRARTTRDKLTWERGTSLQPPPPNMIKPRPANNSSTPSRKLTFQRLDEDDAEESSEN